MRHARQIVEQGLAARAKAGIKIRQPLSSARVIGEALPSDFTELIADELNVKNITYIAGSALAVALDTEITSELAAEGNARELIRTINAMRKDAHLTPGDEITLAYHTESEELKKVFEKFSDELKKSIIANELVEKKNSGEVTDINGEKISLEIGI